MHVSSMALLDTVDSFEYYSFKLDKVEEELCLPSRVSLSTTLNM